MKRTLTIILLLVLLALAICGLAASKAASTAKVDSSKGKTLVLYFSMPETDGVDAVSSASRMLVNGKVVGTTRRVANWIRNDVNGDIASVRVKEAYPTDDHSVLIALAADELEENARPKIVTNIKNFDQYDTVFIGYPIWWGDLPMALYSLFDEYDFSGKTIIPFVTHGGSGLSDTANTIAALEPDAIVSDNGIAIAGSDVSKSRSELREWVRELGF